MSSGSYLIASISNGGGAPEQAYRKLQRAGACPERPYAEMFKFEVPSLTVGTLDTLMTLSDELVKTDAIVEGIVRKIDRVALELSGKSTSDLTVGGVPANRYIQQFAWDSAKYPHRRPLKDLVHLITNGASAVEAELKQLQQSYSEKMSSLQDVTRRKGGNLMTADLNDVLTEEVMSRVEIHDSEYLKTVFIALPKQLKANFESAVGRLGSDLVGYGAPDWSADVSKLGSPVDFGKSFDRRSKTGSPVVPGSCQLVEQDAETMLYAVTILKSQYQAGSYDENNEFVPGSKVDFMAEFAKACKDKRFLVRTDFAWDASASSKSADALEQLKIEVDGMNAALMRWCKTHYGDAFVAWIHIKVIRVFVESVLRYGLPVDFTAVLYKVTKTPQDLTDALDKALGNADGADDEEDAMMEDGEEYHDFVLIKLEP